MAAPLKHLLANRFTNLLAYWLSTLPPYGFRGTVGELWTSMFIVAVKNKLQDELPTVNKLSKALRSASDYLASRGWQLAFKRTNKAALLIIRQVDAL